LSEYSTGLSARPSLADLVNGTPWGNIMKRLHGSLLAIGLLVSISGLRLPHALAEERNTLPRPTATSSSSAPGFDAAGAIDGNRFATEKGAAWQGRAGDTHWWWQIRFPQPRAVGALLQINGDHPLVFRNAPQVYVWQISQDGKLWQDLPETRVKKEARLFRIHRLKKAQTCQYLRLNIDAAAGSAPTVREVELYADPEARIAFDDWIVTVNTQEKPVVLEKPDPFTQLARQCRGWKQVQAQQIWLGSFNEDFVSAEPRPLCAFLSGNFRDWCQRTRETWRGTQEVLRKGRLPMWASCGGAQGLAILAEVGVDKKWDCPHCRDPKNPALPIYTHIGHTRSRPCGDYSCCVFERGKFNVLQVACDPAFEGLPREFGIMESHCGQIAYPPKGWVLVVTKGQGAKTVGQCLRVSDRYIYAAQFHIEMAGTPANSRKIMSNFLALAKKWGGYNPEGRAVPKPRLWPVKTDE
jgi:hypothetical protein